MNLIIASNNKGKLAELTAWLPPDIAAQSMASVGFTGTIPEPFDTFHQNALIKAQTVYSLCRQPTLADDSGICVDKLHGAPGVYSARYAGEEATDEDNNQKLLASMTGQSERKAHYIAVLCLITSSGSRFFEGWCEGRIALNLRGSCGFGYDPLFIPDGYNESFAGLPASVKSQISHRAKALEALVLFLKSDAGAAFIQQEA